MDTIISLIIDGDNLVTKIAHDHMLPHHAEVLYVEKEDNLIPDLPDGTTAIIVNDDATKTQWEFWINDDTQDAQIMGCSPVL